MIAANGATAQFLERQRLPVAAARAALARALGPHRRRWRPLSASGCPRRRALPALQAFLTKRRRADPARFPDLSLVRRQAAGLRRVRAGAPRRPGATATSASRCGTTRTPRRRTGASRISSTQRLLKAALAGRRPARTATTELRDAGPPLHRAGGQRRQGGAPGAQVGGGAAAGPAHRRSASTRS